MHSATQWYTTPPYTTLHYTTPHHTTPIIAHTTLHWTNAETNANVIASASASHAWFMLELMLLLMSRGRVICSVNS